MKCKCFIPYVDYNSDTGFSCDDEYINNNYIKFLTSEYNKYKDSIDLITRKSLNGETTMINSISKKNENKKYKINYSYYEIDCNITDIYDNENIIDMLIENFQKKEMFPLIIKFNNINNNYDFIEELKMWINETYKIKNSTKISEKEKNILLPEKEIKIETDRQSKAILEGCKILEALSINELAIIVKKIIFVK